MKKRKVKKITTHSQDRALERYGIRLTDEDEKEIVRIIRSGEAYLYRLQENGSGIYVVSYKGVNLYAVYCPKVKGIKTYLCKRFLTSGKRTNNKKAVKSSSGYKRRRKHNRSYLEDA